MAFCTGCGTQLPNNGKFCTNCGQAVGRVNSAITQTPNSTLQTVSSNPNYTYSGLAGIYLAIHLTEGVLVIKGAVDKSHGANFQKVVPFSAVRGTRTFTHTTFLLKTEGIEIEINDLDVPVVRISMNPTDTKLWSARLGQVCGLRPY